MTKHYETQLAKELDDAGYHVIRAPASGSKTERDLPDIAWSKPGEPAIFGEHKKTSQDIAYYTQAEVEALQRFAAAFGGQPKLLTRFTQDTTHYMINPEDARRIKSGNYAVDRDLHVEAIL